MASPPPPPPPHLPHYVLIAHSQSQNNLSVLQSTSLSHPVIEYHYADDPPNSLLPQHPGEHVLVLDYDPAHPLSPTVKSLSSDLAISAVKVTDAPAAGVAAEPALRNNSIYLIETMTRPADPPITDSDEQSVHAVLARFKQRNAILHRIVDFPNTHAASHDPPAPSPERHDQMHIR